jgi:hypothetical protein
MGDITRGAYACRPYLLFSLVMALNWRIRALDALIPQAWTKLLYPLDKSNLDPLRLLHFLAIAVLAAWFVPRNWQGMITPVMRCAIRCGQNSLPIYCLGVLLTLASHAALFAISDGPAMQIALSLAGIMAMIATATLLNLISMQPRQPSQSLESAISENAYAEKRRHRRDYLRSWPCRWRQFVHSRPLHLTRSIQ